MSTPNVPAYVAQFAARHGVNLSAIKPEDGKALSLVDVATDAMRRGDPDLWAIAISAQFDWNRGGSGDETAAARDRARAAEDALIDGMAVGRYSASNGRVPGEWSQ